MPDATRLVPDKRASHYWDEPGVTIRAYTEVLQLPEKAWDIYMIYGPNARWKGKLPPRPDYWMHQLGSKGNERVDGPYLDPSEFSERVARSLTRRP